MISIIYGTRPEYLKYKTLLKKFNKENIKYQLIKISQQKDLCIDFPFDHEISIKEFGSRLNSIFSIIPELETQIKDSKYVMVHGDTATSFVSCICAFNMNIPVIHLEAGLRTYDTNNPYPEEAYRQCISSMTSIHLCPTKTDLKNLKNEKKKGKKYLTGNTVLDNLKGIVPTTKNEVIITLHRRENHKLINDWVSEIESVSKLYPEYQFTFICHPNPVVKQAATMFKNVQVISPLSYDDLVAKLSSCSFIITDSGGLQEEGSWFGKKVLICRNTTERKQSLGKTSLLCKKPNKIKSKLNKLLQLNNNTKCPFGDGNACKKIVKIMKDLL